MTWIRPPRKAFRTSTPKCRPPEAVNGTPLFDAKFYLGGTAATYKDIQVGAKWDLLMAAAGATAALPTGATA